MIKPLYKLSIILMLYHMLHMLFLTADAPTVN